MSKIENLISNTRKVLNKEPKKSVQNIPSVDPIPEVHYVSNPNTNTKIKSSSDAKLDKVDHAIKTPICPVVLLSTIEGESNPDILADTTLLHDLPLQISRDLNGKIANHRDILLDPLSKSAIFNYGYIFRDIVAKQVFDHIILEASMNFATAINYSRLSMLCNQTCLNNILYKIPIIYNDNQVEQIPSDRKFSSMRMINQMIDRVVNVVKENARKQAHLVKNNNSEALKKAEDEFLNEFQAVVNVSAYGIANILVTNYAYVIDNEINKDMHDGYFEKHELVDFCANNFGFIAERIAAAKGDQREIALSVSIGLKELFKNFLSDFLYNILGVSVANSLRMIKDTKFELFESYVVVNGLDNYKYYEEEWD